MESTATIRSLLAENRPRTPSVGYPPDVRMRAAAYMSARLATGARPSVVGRELGISRQSAVDWTKACTPPAAIAMVPVAVVPDEETARVSVPVATTLIATTWSAHTGTLVSPRGFRVEGLDLDGLLRLLEKLG